MASVVYTPKMKFWIPGSGNPAASYNVQFYAAGTTTNQAVFLDAACTIPAANPVQLDGNGEALVYAVPGTLYKISLYDVTNTVQQSGYPVDSVGIYGTGSGGGGSSGVSEFVASGLVPAFINGTSFSFPVAAGNLTSTYTKGLVIQTTQTAGTAYFTVTGSAFTTFTTVTVTPYQGSTQALDSGLSVVNYSGQNALNPSAPDKSFYSILYVHNTETLANGVGYTMSTTNGFGVTQNSASGLPSLGEFSTSTGLFTAARAGFYQVSVGCALTDTGVTFNGTNNITLGGGSGTSLISMSAGTFMQIVAGLSNANAFLNVCAYVAAGASFGLRIGTAFSAGQPVLNSATMTIVGPL